MCVHMYGSADHSKKRDQQDAKKSLFDASSLPRVLLSLAHTMSSEENHASSSVSQCTYQDVIVAHAPQTTKIKKEPTETRMTLGPSSPFKLAPSEPMRVKSESNELFAKVNYFFLDPRLVVYATFFQCLDPTAASGADDTNEEMKQSLQSVVPNEVKSYIAPLFEEHKSAEEIAYSPEAAVKEYKYDPNSQSTNAKSEARQQASRRGLGARNLEVCDCSHG